MQNAKKEEEENLCIFALYTMISTSSVIIMHNFSFWKKKKKRCAKVCIICEKQERRSIDWLVFNANFSNISALRKKIYDDQGQICIENWQSKHCVPISTIIFIEFSIP
jgi:hypothetical protein